MQQIQRKGRPWIAMIAAYAVALQMLLSAAVGSQIAATAPDAAAALCYGSVIADASGQGDVVHLHQASCILCSVGLSAPVDLAAAAASPAYDGRAVLVAAPAATPHLPQAPPSPRLSQGPPRIA
jgi:hypothetical protein